MNDKDPEQYGKNVRDNLEKLTRAFAGIAAGDYTGRINIDNIDHDDEFYKVFSGLEKMISGIVDERTALSDSAQRLEQQVAERTKEISAAYERQARDIAERQRSQDMFTEREHFYMDIFNSIQDPISILDTNLCIVGTNDAMEQWYKEKLPLAGKKCYWVYHHKDSPCTQCPSLQTIKTGQAAFEVVPKRNALGQQIGWSALYSFPWKDIKTGEIKGVIEYIKDISELRQAQDALVSENTERQKLEAELFKAKKLESLGVLAGGIAHDFNNILTGIITNLFMSKLRIKHDQETFQLLSEAEKASFRASKLVKQLLTFSKGGAPVKEIISIRQIVEDSVGFCLSGSNVNYKLDIAEGLAMVEADRGQIDQVLNNLIINADQAMPEGGTVYVSAKNVIVNVRDVAESEKNATLVPDEYVKIEIRDEGIGIPRENMEKIFDPYFTTKQNGNGLGLTIAYSIVKAHKGGIAVESAVGKGTTVSLFLPVAKIKDNAGPKMQSALKNSGSGEKILIMDDDAAIRSVLKQLLQSSGYDAVCTSTGNETIEAYGAAQKNGACFKVVVMDLTIPGGMGGKEAVAKILEIDKNAKVVVASGYSNDPIMANYHDYGFCDVIAKPFNIDEFLAVIKKAAIAKQ